MKALSGFLFITILYSCGESATTPVEDDNSNVTGPEYSDSATHQEQIWESLYDSVPPLSDEEFKAKYTDFKKLNGQKHYRLTWDILADVEFEERFNVEEQAYFDYPTYSPDVLAFHNREIIITGHLIPFEPETGGYFLSANPNASCFFCGEAGPETVIALTIEDVTDEMVMDAVLTFRGKLLLNRKDVFQMNYRIPNAVLVQE